MPTRNAPALFTVVEDEMYEAAGHLDDRRPGLLFGPVRQDSTGDPVISISRHTGEVDSFAFDVDETIAPHGRARPSTDPMGESPSAAMAAHAKRTLERMHALETLTEQTQAEMNRAELCGLVVATDQDTATARTNLNEVDDFGGKPVSIEAGDQSGLARSRILVSRPTGETVFGPLVRRLRARGRTVGDDPDSLGV